MDKGVVAGRVYIVGAGPGHPDLISVRGMRLLQAADVVVYAGSLVPAAMLDYCRPEAERIDTRSQVLETLLPTVVDRARAGQVVVRLQDGDPCLYGALQEMTVALLAAGVEFEVVPGVSAFQAAAARLGVELTVPDLVQSIILTRASGRTAVPEAEDLASLAAHRASLCLYLSAHHAKDVQATLLEHYPAETAIAICYRIGWPDEQILSGTLSQLHDLTKSAKLNRTVLYLVSPALDVTAPARSQLYSPSHVHLFRPHRPHTTLAPDIT
ncbi:precorrin-4 C(11)-methyltransferase [Synechococcus sp. PCC 7336]|uniref:precorrin-4 C(11)-methyltransferase n=1 Tax=Synechococcus sp. PCC 7336 TaxID=195250 RepID=UPI000348A22D|nr:precorrin-4 C(11)-methyltransferase [Synechococcus sp. PCC 7336]